MANIFATLARFILTDGPRYAQTLANVLLSPLPADSPELNPAEQVWQQPRNQHLANRCFDSYEQIVNACCDAWNAFTDMFLIMRRNE